MKKLFLLLLACPLTHGMQKPVSQLVVGTVDNQTSHPATLTKWHVVADRKGELGKEIAKLPAKEKSLVNVPLALPLPQNEYYQLNILADPAKNQNPANVEIVVRQEGNVLHVKTIKHATSSVSEGTYSSMQEREYSYPVTNKPQYVNIVLAGDKFQDSSATIASSISTPTPVKLQPSADLAPAKPAARPLPIPGNAVRTARPLPTPK